MTPKYQNLIMLFILDHLSSITSHPIFCDKLQEGIQYIFRLICIDLGRGKTTKPYVGYHLGQSSRTADELLKNSYGGRGPVGVQNSFSHPEDRLLGIDNLENGDISKNRLQYQYTVDRFLQLRQIWIIII